MNLTPQDELAERPYERLRRMLDRAGLSNRAVADSLEVAPETVSRWRSGQAEPRGRDVRALVALLATRGIAVTERWIGFGAGGPAASTDAAKRLSGVIRAGGTEKDLVDEAAAATDLPASANESRRRPRGAARMPRKRRGDSGKR